MIEDPLDPDEDELAMGVEAACELVAHMKRMRSLETTLDVLDGSTVWKITVEAKTMGKVN